jgi:hypothetical protein
MTIEPETEEELAAARAEAKAAGLNEWDRPEKIAAYIDANIIPIAARTVMEQLGIQILVVHRRRLPNAPQAIVQARRRLDAAAARAVRVGKARREDGATRSRVLTAANPEPAAMQRRRAVHRAVL